MSLCVGIDLGTSNSAIAVAESLDQEAAVVPVTQLTAPGTLGEKAILPSALYIPHEGELEAEVAGLPWKNEKGKKKAPDFVIGLWARERGALVPERLVTSAKSWLCNPLVDRKAPILPWKSEIAESKLSPVEVSRRYLEHLKRSFEYAKETKLADCRVVLTVPASFDEVARGLTYEAAEAAGLSGVTLLEEPQAAFYAWVAGSEGQWRERVKPGDLVLVVDVGGGTTDFSLIAVSQTEGNLKLDRISVGEHLLLGGDNMDLALAYRLKAQLEAEGSRVDHWQLLTLVHAARDAKERLLGDESLEEVPLSVASRGASLFAKTLTTRLTRKMALETALDGFFPLTAAGEMPAARRSAGLQEYGLPFVSDPAISRHLARFLQRSLENVRSDEHLSELVGKHHELGHRESLLPTAVLFNGGVFNASLLRGRVLELLRSWSGDKAVRELPGSHLDLAVAKGAAYYARTLEDGKGIRIKAGTARSYYLGLEPSMPAVPGFEPPIKGLCVVPQGLEEGSEISLPSREFGLVTGEPVEFRFFSSAVRAGDGVGAVVDDATHELEETARLEITLPSVEGKSGEVVPVELDAVVTEVGTLELFMKHTQSDRKWNLEFNVRPSNG